MSASAHKRHNVMIFDYLVIVCVYNVLEAHAMAFDQAGIGSTCT